LARLPAYLLSNAISAPHLGQLNSIVISRRSGAFARRHKVRQD
jgi:hypothetical protein